MIGPSLLSCLSHFCLTFPLPLPLPGFPFFSWSLSMSLHSFFTSLFHLISLAHSLFPCSSSCSYFLLLLLLLLFLSPLQVNTLQNWLAEFNLWLPTQENLPPDTDESYIAPRAFRVFILNDEHK